MDPLIELNRVAFGYGAFNVLDDIDLHLHPGQFVGLVGPSGAGKTSLLKLILTLLTPREGEIQRVRPDLRITYVPQIETVDWSFPRHRRGSGLDGPRPPPEYLALASPPRAPTGARNPGPAWRSAIWRNATFAISPADSSNASSSPGPWSQTPKSSSSMSPPPVSMSAVPKISSTGSLCFNREGMTILLTTHDLNMAAAHVPWVVCLNRRIVAQGPPQEIFTEEILSDAYKGNFIVLRQDDMIFVQQRPHPHGLKEVLPRPR